MGTKQSGAGRTPLARKAPAPMPSSPPAHRSRSRRWLLPLVVVLLWLFVGGPLGSFAGRLAEVQKNDNASFLPKSAESTGVLDEFLKFTGRESLPATVVFERPGGVTPGDEASIPAYAGKPRTVETVDGSQVAPPTYSQDGT